MEFQSKSGPCLACCWCWCWCHCWLLYPLATRRRWRRRRRKRHGCVTYWVTFKVLYFALTSCHYRSDQIRSVLYRPSSSTARESSKEAYKISIGRLSFNDPPQCLLHPILASTRDSWLNWVFSKSFDLKKKAEIECCPSPPNSQLWTWNSQLSQLISNFNSHLTSN